MTKSAWEDDWQRAARERDDLVAERDALAAELASQVAWKERYMRDLLEGADRIHELEAFLVKVLPPGIEDGCDECGGDLAKCHAENPDCYIAEARRLLPSSVPETACECMPLSARGAPGDLEVYCPKCGKVFRKAETACEHDWTVAEDNKNDVYCRLCKKAQSDRAGK